MTYRQRRIESWQARMVRLATPYLVPWILGVLLLPAAVLTRATAGGSAWAALLMAAGTAAVTAVARAVCETQERIVRRLAVATAAGGGGWWTVVTITGYRPAWAGIWATGLVVLAASWDMVHAVHRRGGRVEMDGGLGGVGSILRRARVRKPQLDGERVSVEVETPRGVPVAPVLTDPATLAAHMDVPTSWVRTAEGETARRATVTIVPDDLLDHDRSWTPSRPGGSIADPLVIGVGDDGEPLTLWLPEDRRIGRPSTSLIVAGMSGSGKTETVLTLVAEAMRDDAEVWWLDWVKGIQSRFPVDHALTRVGETEAQVRALLRELVHETIPARAQHLGARGLKGWERRCGLMYLVIVLGEASSLPGPLLEELARSIRSVGGSLILDTQRVQWRSLPTGVSANVGGRLVHGVATQREAQELLSTAARRAGARPEAWQNHRPGLLYAEAPGIPRARLAVPYRRFLADPDELRRAVPPRDRAEAPVTVPDDGPVAGRVVSTDEARRMVTDRIAALRAEGRTEVTPADFDEVRAVRSAAWLTGELRARCEPGGDLEVVAHGRYRIRGVG